VRIYEAQSDGYEASWLAEEVQALKRAGCALPISACCYRSNAQSRIIEHGAFSNGIPYRVYGGLRFFERMEIKHALAYLRLAANPDDDGAFLRVANSLARNRRSLARNPAGCGQGGNASLYKAPRDLPEKSGAAARHVPAPSSIAQGGNAGAAFARNVEVMLEKSGLVAHLQGRKRRRRPGRELERARERGGCVHIREDEHDLSAFLAHASLESGENQAGEGADALHCLTVHSAKGLSFTRCSSRLEEGLFSRTSRAFWKTAAWKKNAG